MTEPAASPPKFRVRRATVDDLPALKELWTSMRLPADEFEKRLTEFQVVESPDQPVAGVIGIEISRQHARLHSESYRDFAMADEMRSAVFERIHSLASNHGVFRLWTQERAPFWTKNGFQIADPEILKKLPEQWAPAGGAWLTLQLKDEQAVISLEKELAMYMESEKQRTARAFQQARLLKMIATVLAVIFAIFIIGVLLYVFHKNHGSLLPRR